MGNALNLYPTSSLTRMRSFEMNATLFQVGIPLVNVSQNANLYLLGYYVCNLGCSSSFTDLISFVEENHEYKARSQMRQSQQVPQPGRPSQDMMSFWGKQSNTVEPTHKFNVTRLQV